MHVRNPVTWVFAQIQATEVLGSTPAHEYFTTTDSGVPPVRQISRGAPWRALRDGWGDFAAARTDLVTLWLIYPVMALYIAAADTYGQLIPLLLPVAAGFTLVGPLFAIGFYEISRRREISGVTHWTDGFGVLRSPSIGGIFALGLGLIGLFAAWLAVAWGIYQEFLGPILPPATGAAGWTSFFTAAFTTLPGWEMLTLGALAGAVFAVLVLVIASVSFPLLLDRPATLGAAIRTSISAIKLNPGPLALWGAIVAGGLILGTLPLFIGLIIVLPILGHGTWHLYRAMVPQA